MIHERNRNYFGQRKAEVLAMELARANTHLYFFRGLETEKGLPVQVKDFWDFTLTAHVSVALLQISRVYDRHKRGVNLHRLLKRVKPGNLDSVQEEQLRRFQGFLHGPTAKKYLQWRNQIVAHLNLKIALRDRDMFLAKNPPKVDEMQRMIDIGFEIVEWFSKLHGGSGLFQRLPEIKDGHEFAIRVLRKALTSQEKA